MNQSNIQTEPDTLDGERGVPSVNDAGSGRGRKIAFAIFAVVIVFALLIFLVIHFMGGSSSSQSTADKPAHTSDGSTVPARTFTMPPLPEKPAPAPAKAVAVVPAPAEQAPALPGDAGGKPVPTLDKSASALMVTGSNSSGSTGQPAAAPAAAPLTAMRMPGAGKDAASSQSKGPLSGLLTGTKTDTRQASMLQHRNFLLAKGSFINCVLQTRLDSTVPGMTSCVVTRNVYSDTGKVLLIERGSTVSGEYQSNLRHGMNRIYVLWTRIKTPNGVVIDLDSPGADPLGGSGLPGHVNSHFWKRFGGAMLLSLVDDVARAATQNNGSSGQVNFNSTGDAATDMASIALRNTINIPPTLYKNQGEAIGIYVARDLDFSSVYDVQPE